MEEADERQAPGAFVLILGGETEVNQLLAWDDSVLTTNAGMSAANLESASERVRTWRFVR